jgi:hypothetical protein
MKERSFIYCLIISGIFHVAVVMFLFQASSSSVEKIIVVSEEKETSRADLSYVFNNFIIDPSPQPPFCLEASPSASKEVSLSLPEHSSSAPPSALVVKDETPLAAAQSLEIFHLNNSTNGMLSPYLETWGNSKESLVQETDSFFSSIEVTPSLNEVPTDVSIDVPAGDPPSSDGLHDVACAALDWSSFFDIDLQTFLREDGGYFFSITVQPKESLEENRLPQNYYFLIDLSRSIDKKKLQSFKQAILRAISYLRQEDNFTIIILDNNLTTLSQSPLPFNKKNLEEAKLFLYQFLDTGKKYSMDFYTSLNRLDFSGIDTKQLHTAILFSDGNAPFVIKRQQKDAAFWMVNNRNHVVLYTAAVGPKNNLPMLELFSVANGGSALYSDTYAGFSRKCAQLVIDIKTPLIRNPFLYVSNIDPSAKIEILPTPSHLPNIFQKQPLVLLGKSEKLADFTLLIEGENYNKSIVIKKNIEFSQAKIIKRSFEKKWNVYQAHALYQQCLQGGSPKLLKEAQQLLSYEPTYYQR